MFKFYGSLSNNILKQSAKKQNKFIMILFSIVDFIALCISMIFIFVDYSYFPELISITSLLIIISIALVLCPPKSIIYKLPKLIIFNLEDDSITQEIEQVNNKPHFRKISNIKAIHDYGEYYFITFKKDISDNLVCQKNLLSIGTIKEFESYFKEKIVKHF